MTVLLMMPFVAAGGPIYDEDYYEGQTGSWTLARVTGWWDPPDQTICNIYHYHDYDFAQGYWGIPHYEVYPTQEGQNALEGWTLQRVYVYQDSQLKETVGSFASIPYN